MTDRELLELAAKAEGRKWLSYHHTKGLCCRDDRYGGLIEYYWNPLTDDGDAFRLSSKLWMEVRHVHGQAHAGMAGRFWCTEPWFPDGDQDAATRRAIVRAAAEIGKSITDSKVIEKR